jgi:hypothetical protein
MKYIRDGKQSKLQMLRISTFSWGLYHYPHQYSRFGSNKLTTSGHGER